MNKKGFTLVELLAVIVILAVVVVVAVPTFNKYVLNSEKQYYKNLEKTVKTSGMEYLNENSVFFPKEVGEYFVVDEEALKNSGIIEGITDSEGKACEEVKVIIQKKESGSYEYETCLKCEDYETNTPICKGDYDGDGNKDEDDGTDKTGPSLADIQIVKKTTNSITVEAICRDEQSGIAGYQYKINNNEYTAFTTEKSYKFDGLEDSNDYLFKVKCYNGNNLSRESKTINAVTASFSNPTMKAVKTAEGYPIDGFEYSPKRDIQITYNNYNIEEEDAEYFLKSSVSVVTNVSVNECEITTIRETGNNEDIKYQANCLDTRTTRMEANKWYRTERLKISTTFASDTNPDPHLLFAMIGDGINLSGISSFTVDNIDNQRPTISAKANPKILGDVSYNFIDNVNYTFGFSFGDVFCDPPGSMRTGVYNVTCIATGNNGLRSSVTFEAKHSYPATYVKKTCTKSVNCINKSYCAESYSCDPWECDWSEGFDTSSCTQHFNSTCCKRYSTYQECDTEEYDCSYYECRTADGKKDNSVTRKGNTCYY